MVKYARKSYLRDRTNLRANRASQTDLSRRRLYFNALAKGLAAGLTPGQCMSTLKGDVSGTETKNLTSLATKLDNGQSVTEAFSRLRIASDLDLALLEIGEAAGRLADVTSAIADRYQQTIDRSRKMKSGLRQPLILGLLALVLLPIPEVAAGRLDLAQYLMIALAYLLVGLLAWHLLRYLFNQAASAPESYPAHPFIDLPLIGPLLLDFSRASFLERLSLLFSAGYPIIEATERSHESLVGFARRRRYRQIGQDLHAGYSISDTFEHHEILNAHQLPILISGDQAGRLEDALTRIAVDARQTLDAKLDAIATWFPRLVYTLLSIFIASQLIA